MNPEELELIDSFLLGLLSQEKQSLVEEKMKNDPSFRLRVEEHQSFLKSLKEYDDHKTLKMTLNEIQMGADISSNRKSFSMRMLWPTVGIAASVALLCAVGTLFLARWFDQEHSTNYLELRKNVERLKKSQSQILENIKKENNKKDYAPENYSGSGFLISSNGYVVTSYHVVKAADSVYIENEKFGKLKTSVVYSSPENDISLLMILDDKFQATRPIACAIRGKEADIGEGVYTLGFPREEIVYGEGSISASTGYQQNENAYQVSVPVNPGNSGGPLIDQQGSLIGIVNGVQTQTRGAAFAIKSETLLETLKNIPTDSLNRPLKITTQNQLAGMSRVNQVKRWRDLVFIVKVFNAK